MRAGMLSSTMEQIAFSDADLKTPLDYLNELRVAVERGADVAIGSRKVGAGRSVSRRTGT